MAILEYWMGRASKEDVAQRLETSPLRVWQLSQQALSGMLVGLLRLPRTRRRLGEDFALRRQDTQTLKQRIAELEKKLARTEDLVRVLKHLPWKGESENGVVTKRVTGKKRARKKATKPRETPGDRTMAPGEATSG
jgi:hypothetical protein